MTHSILHIPKGVEISSGISQKSVRQIALVTKVLFFILKPRRIQHIKIDGVYSNFIHFPLIPTANDLRIRPRYKTRQSFHFP